MKILTIYCNNCDTMTDHLIEFKDGMLIENMCTECEAEFGEILDDSISL